jgi:hypothetical protein
VLPYPRHLPFAIWAVVAFHNEPFGCGLLPFLLLAQPGNTFILEHTGDAGSR